MWRVFVGNRDAFRAVVPGEEAFREGDNDLEIFAIEPALPLRLFAVSIRN